LLDKDTNLTYSSVAKSKCENSIYW